MHEMTVAQSLIQIISDEAAKHNAKPLAAKISCGTLNPINDEALRFAFEAIGKDTLCEGIKIQIEHIPLRAKCKDCGEDFNIEISNPQCDSCSGECFELMPDAPLMLEEIDFETE